MKMITCVICTNQGINQQKKGETTDFYDNFFYLESKESNRRKVAMSVPVEGVKIVLDSISKTLEGIDYQIY